MRSLADRMSFRSEWRLYQRAILSTFDARDPAASTFHVVAPPGSGKTVVGIELARRMGRPAVAFAPTTTIQEQWKERFSLFLPDGDPAGDVSLDPLAPGEFTCLTYQSLSAPAQDDEFRERLGRAAWIDELIRGGLDEADAGLRLDAVEATAPDEYRDGVSRRARTRKRELLAAGEVRLDDLLHPNVLALRNRLVAKGVRCLLLDEAHHLRDYWALILKDLIGRLPGALVIGLTATPPTSAPPDELANYLALVGDVDFEVPTPAVVRSGHLAPYQDLALVVKPTDEEMAFLEGQDEILEGLVRGCVEDPRFTRHIESRIARTDAPGPRPWEDLLAQDFAFAVGGVRFLVSLGRPLPDDVDMVPELAGPLTEADELALVREWCLGFLRASGAPEDRRTLHDLRAALRSFGLTMTETGWRQGASATERVLAYSRAKVLAMVEILEREAAWMGDRLRAVVLTDFERSSAMALRRLEGVLDPRAGGAVGAVRALTADARTNALHPVMITAATVLVSERFAEAFAREATAWMRADEGRDPRLTWREASEGLVEFAGAWSPRDYVAFVTDLFEQGAIRCIVGTRGLLAEGWDAIRLNTLVDLTTVGTFAGVNQIRGRSIRLDPADLRKVANNWDVACFAPRLPGGRSDLERLVAKHRHVWGLARSGRIVRGIAHVDEELAFVGTMFGSLLHEAELADVRWRTWWRAEHRDRAYEAWHVGSPYENFESKTTRLDPGPRPPRTAFTLRRSLRAILNTAFANIAILAWIAFRIAPTSPKTAIAAALVVLIGSGVFLWEYVRRAFLDLPPDPFLLDFGRSIAEALRQSGLAPAVVERVRVSEDEAGALTVRLDTKDARTAELFAEAYRDLFVPIVDQRYLVVRDELMIRTGWYRPAWFAIRALLSPFRRHRRRYHPVPAVFARNRDLAETFARSWGRWVGGGRLVYTRSEGGMRILLRERAAFSVGVRADVEDEWR